VTSQPPAPSAPGAPQRRIPAFEAPAPAGPAQTPGGRLAARHRIPFNGYIVVLTTLVTLTFLMFTLVEPTPRWLLIFAAAITAIGVDGVLRATWREAFTGEQAQDTTPYLFLPALYVLAAPILIEHNVRGYWVIPASLGAGIAFGGVVVAAAISVHERAPEFGVARLVATGVAYFAAFSLFSMTYVVGLDARTAIVAIGLVGTMLAVEVLREGQVDPAETLVFAVICGLVVAETRWSLHYLPLDGYLAGLSLVLVFFLVTGLLNAHLTSRLDAVLAAEYVLIAAVGLALVVLARASGAA
jgi:hypothetical protein